MISAIIPVYNEHEGITSVVSELIQKLEEMAGNEFEIILVNDHSDEKTQQALASFSHPHIVIAENIVNMGYGFSLKKGIRMAKYDTILILDGDGSYPLKNLSGLHTIYTKGYDLLVATRGKQFSEDSLIKSIFRKFLRFIVEFSAGIKIPDVNSGMRFFSARTIDEYLPLMSDRFSFTTSMTLLYALDRKTIHFEENGYNKRKGKSKVNLRKDIFRTLQIIAEIIALKNPLKIHLFLILLNTLVWFSIVIICIFIQPQLIWTHVQFYLLILFLQFSFAAYAIQTKKHNFTAKGKS